jgi:hypothetical protein
MVCGNFNDWRRYLSFSPTSTTIIALITALVSVIASAAPNLMRLLQRDDSRVEVKFTGDDHSGGILLVGYNSGDRPGSITDIKLDIPFRDKPLSTYGTYDTKVGDGDGFLLPGVTSGKKMRVMFPDVKFDQSKYTKSDLGGECVIEITITEFSGNSTKAAFHKPCDTLSVVGIR